MDTGTGMPRRVNLAERLATFDETWVPKVVADLNGQQVKVAKFLGEYVWHHHADEDEAFLVVQGRLRMLFRDGEVVLGPGELIVVPRGVEHKPVADELVHCVLFEPATTRNTGDVTTDLTLEPGDLERI